MGDEQAETLEYRVDCNEKQLAEAKKRVALLEKRVDLLERKES